jgi:hypothetical protein
MSADYFAYLALYVQALLVEQQCTLRQQPIPTALTSWKQLDSVHDALLVVDTEDGGTSTTTTTSFAWRDMLQDVTVVVGSFGRRQGVELYSDMGPFCHSFQV